jgi:hypothetical protein
MNPVSLYEAATNLHHLIRFIEGADFIDALDAIGDTAFKAAKLAMTNARKTKDRKRKREEVTLAVGHLQSAHCAYHSIWTKYDGTLSKPFTITIAAKKDSYACSLMALCYRYLGDESLKTDFIRYANDANGALARVRENSPPSDWGDNGKAGLAFLILLARQKKSWVDSGSGSLPSE